MQWLVDWQDAMPGEAAESLALLLQNTHDEAFEAGCASPCGHPPTPPQNTERHMWLLSGASSAGRTTIPVEQYEELRALATKWSQDFYQEGAQRTRADRATAKAEERVKELEAKLAPDVLTLYYIEDADFNRRGPFESYQHAADNCRTHKSERVVTKDVEKIKPHDERNCINCNSNAKPKETNR